MAGALAEIAIDTCEHAVVVPCRMEVVHEKIKEETSRGKNKMGQGLICYIVMFYMWSYLGTYLSACPLLFVRLADTGPIAGPSRWQRFPGGLDHCSQSGGRTLQAAPRPAE